MSDKIIIGCDTCNGDYDAEVSNSTGQGIGSYEQNRLWDRYCMLISMHMFNIKGTDIRYKTVGRSNATAGRVNLPVGWVDKRVAIVLLE